MLLRVGGLRSFSTAAALFPPLDHHPHPPGVAHRLQLPLCPASSSLSLSPRCRSRKTLVTLRRAGVITRPTPSSFPTKAHLAKRCSGSLHGRSDCEPPPLEKSPPLQSHLDLLLLQQHSPTRPAPPTAPTPGPLLQRLPPDSRTFLPRTAPHKSSRGSSRLSRATRPPAVNRSRG